MFLCRLSGATGENPQPSTAASVCQTVEHGSDIFASLLGDKGGIDDKQISNQKRSHTISGDDVSVTIATYSASDWTVQSALIYKDILLILARVNESGNNIIQALTARLAASLGGVKVPSFLSSTPLLQYTLVSQDHCAQAANSRSTRVLNYKPALSIVHRGLKHEPGRVLPEVVFSIQDDLYTQLFGPECKLANSPILLLGSQNGHIFYWDLNRLECLEGTKRLVPLYSLEQPVVTIHALHVPQESGDHNLLLLSDSSPSVNGTPNLLLFVGQKGKIVVCTAGNSTQKFVNFSEFHVPGPILSSLLLEGQCLLYSTLKGVYEVCLKPGCIRKSTSSSVSSSTSVLIPERMFMFPNKVSHAISFVLVPVADEPTVPAAASAGTKLKVCSRVVCMSPSGQVSSLNICTEIESRNTSVVAQDLRQSLTAIQATAKQIATAKHKLDSLNASLSQLNDALSLLCDVARLSDADGEKRPFCCTLQPAFEEVGVSSRRAIIQVQLSYSGSKPLGTGWVFVVQIHSPEATNLPSCIRQQRTVVSSHVSPITNLNQTGCLRMHVNVEASSTGPLACSVYCFLHYNTTNIHSGRNMDSPASGSVSLPLCSKSFDALDFLQPLHSSPKELISTRDDPTCLDKILNPSQTISELVPQCCPLHSLEVTIPTTAVCGSGSDIHASFVSFLKKLVPVDTARTVEESSAEVKLTAHDGSPVCLKMVPQDSDFKLVIQTASRKLLTEIVSCVECRIQHCSGAVGPDGSEERTHEQLCRKLTRLQVSATYMTVAL